MGVPAPTNAKRPAAAGGYTACEFVFEHRSRHARLDTSRRPRLYCGRSDGKPHAGNHARRAYAGGRMKQALYDWGGLNVWLFKLINGIYMPLYGNVMVFISS